MSQNILNMDYGHQQNPYFALRMIVKVSYYFRVSLVWMRLV